MAKIPFNIDYRPQVESGEYKVVTATDDPVRILAWDLLGDYPIAAAKWEEGDPHSTVVDTYDPDGWDGMGTKQPDLYIVTPESAPVISEDEKFRKYILQACKDCVEADDEGLELSMSTTKKLLDYLEKQKPAEWNEDCREEDLRTRFAFYTYKDEDSVLYLSNVFVEETSRNKGFGTKILAAAERVAEAIGAVTICLKVKQDSPANAWYRKHGYGYVAFEDGYDWLEKNLEYLKPTAPEAERSEEDEKMLTDISWAIRHCAYSDKKREQVHDWFENHFKSLRPYYQWKPNEQEKGALRTAIHVLTEERNFPKAAEQLQNILDAFEGKESHKEWKPSDEQLRPLEYAIDYFKKKKNDTTYLESLYNDLKKL